MTSRRGLTLIEVLLAVALLAMLAGVVASAATDLRRASLIEPWQDSFDQLTLVANRSLDHIEMPLHVWPESRSEIVQLPSGDSEITLEIQRIPCPDCPERIGLFQISAFGQDVHRFSPVLDVTPEADR